MRTGLRAACRAAAILVLSALSNPWPAQADGPPAPDTYRNPLPLVSASLGAVENCSDPDVLEGPEGDPSWYLYCTGGPLRADEIAQGGGQRWHGALGWHQIPMFRSLDLVHWDYAGDAFDDDPATATAPLPPALAPGADLWAPEVERIGGRFYLFYTMTATVEDQGGMKDCKPGSSIGYAVSDTPLGPWKAADAPLVPPRRPGGNCKTSFWTIDPEVFSDAAGQYHIFYGGASGGIEGRKLLVGDDGALTAPADSAVPITIGNRWSFEGAEVVQVDGLYYLFASATNCCNGPQTGYSVVVGRSTNPTGPFIDRQGASLLDETVGGTPVLVQNGNRWIGPGHNAVFQDRAGDWWTMYHAVDEADPYFAGMVGFTKRTPMLDSLDWVKGWPVVNGGAGPSDGPETAPAARPDQLAPRVRMTVPVAEPQPGPIVSALSDEFDSTALPADWAASGEGAMSLKDGVLRLDTREGKVGTAPDAVPVLAGTLPPGDALIETRLRFVSRGPACCPHGLEAGIAVLGDGGNFIKLVVKRVKTTWQTEFGRGVSPVPEKYPTYGNSIAGPPGRDWTWLRIAVQRRGPETLFTAFTSRDGLTWDRGATWRHRLGDDARIGLVATGGSGFTAEFDYLRVTGIAQ